LARIEGTMDLASAEARLQAEGLTLGATLPSRSTTLAAWLASGAPGARDRWLDPVDQLLAGLEATLNDGRPLVVHPAPRRAVGPDLTALLVGAGDRFGRIDRAWMRVHPLGVPRHSSTPFEHDRDPALSAGERSVLDSISLGVSPAATPSAGRP
jgi:alkyldihydroxyacetonephosphate synthase